MSTGGEEGGYKNSGGAEDRGDSSTEVPSEDAGGDLSGDSSIDQSEDAGEDRIDLEDPGGDLGSSDSLQTD